MSEKNAAPSPAPPPPMDTCSQMRADLAAIRSERHSLEEKEKDLITNYPSTEFVMPSVQKSLQKALKSGSKRRKVLDKREKEKIKKLKKVCGY